VPNSYNDKNDYPIKCDEWYINDTENIIIIKYNEDIINEDEINNILQKIHNKE